MPSDAQQDHTQKSSQAPPTKKSIVYQADGAESTLCRPPTLHKQPPALPPKPFNRLPNHITGECVSMRAHNRISARVPNPPTSTSSCRRRPHEVAMHVG